MSKSDSTPAAPALAETPNELERLRDILFGAQSRTIEERLLTLDARVTQLYQELNGRLQEQERTFQTDLNTLNSTLQQTISDAEQNSHQRDEALQTKLQGLDQRLEGTKVSRQELGQLLIEMGQQLQRAVS
jgi:phenylalanyl-tRNA synthetase alpha subunit